MTPLPPASPDREVSASTAADEPAARADRSRLRLIRRALPFTALLPLGFAAIALWLLREGHLDPTYAITLVAIATCLTGALSVAVVVPVLGGIDTDRAGTAAALARARTAEAEQARLAAELAQSGRRIQGILDSAVDPYIGLGACGTVVSWNTAAERLFGWSEEEAIGRSVSDLISIFSDDGHPLDQPLTGAFYDRMAERGPISCVMIRKDGLAAEVEARVWVQDEKDGRRYTAIIRDIARRRRNERELQDLNRSIDELITVAADDLRGPLTVANGDLEALRDNAGRRADAGDLALIHRVQGATARSVHLIDELLAYARAGRTTFEPQRVDLVPLCGAVVAEVAARSERPFHVGFDGLLPVSGEPGTLRQVFANLIDNAVRHCPNDRVPQVTVGTEIAADHTQVLVTIDDNGAGIPAEERDTLFELFTRGSTGQDRESNGVGLAFCRKVVERHNGHIWIEDSPAGGARFCLTLPRRFLSSIGDEHEPDMHETLARVLKSLPDEPALRGRHTLAG